MKKLILLLAAFFICIVGKAQESTTDYIYSSDGFEVKVGVIERMGDYNTPYASKSKGLYSKDGRILVSCISPDKYRFYVIDGCEIICSGAFQGFNSCVVYIPSSVKYIAPDALITYISASGGGYTNRFGGIQDGCMEEGANSIYSPVADKNTTEVARYNMQGIKLNEPASGINIIRQSDGTTEKVLVK